MSNDISVVNAGKFAKPVNTLIKKTANAIGILYEPRKIRQKAIAEADAAKTKALADLEIADIQKRALNRLVIEEIKKQENIESIMEKSFENINEDATPEDIEDDWISNFFDKCKLISDEEMQTLWSKILADEANNPGNYSKRTIDFMSTMDKKDAQAFERLGQFCSFFGAPLAFVFDYNHNIYNSKLSFSDIQHLDDIGLITFDLSRYFDSNISAKNFKIGYHGRVVNVDTLDINKRIKTGNIFLTKIAVDLLPTIYPKFRSSIPVNSKLYNDDFFHYFIEELYKQNIVLSEPLENKFYAK